MSTQHLLFMAFLHGFTHQHPHVGDELHAQVQIGQVVLPDLSTNDVCESIQVLFVGFIYPQASLRVG